MVRAKDKQQVMFTEADTPLAKACDELIDARDEKEKASESYEVAQSKVVELMQAQARKTLKHRGRLFSLRETDPKVSVAIKEG